MRSKTMLLSILVTMCFSVQAKPKNITVQDVKHLALKQCLIDNYHDLTPADTISAPSRDASFMVESYALGNAGVWDAFVKFVAKETKDYDKLTMSLHPDHAKTANNVLAQCMAFYESDKLDKYARNLLR